MMELWHCVELYLSVQNTPRAAEKGRNHQGVEGTLPWHQCCVFERGSAKTPDLISTNPIQSHPQPLHHPYPPPAVLPAGFGEVGARLGCPGFAEELDSCGFLHRFPELLFLVLPTITEMSFLRDKSVIVVGSFLWCLFSR